MSTRREEINRQIEKLRIVSGALEEIKKLNQERIHTLSWQNRAIERNISDVKFISDLYGPLSDSAINAIPESAYPIFIDPLSRIAKHGDVFLLIRDDAKKRLDYTDRFSAEASGSSAVFDTSIADSAVYFAEQFGSESNEGNRLKSIIDQYKQAIHLDEETDYIAATLTGLVPDISQDFSHFLGNYYASSQNDLKYQELIAFRTMFFLKLIDASASLKGYSTSTPRRGRIIAFMTGKSQSNDPQINQLADTAMELWESLSSQDMKTMSIKLGNVTSSYIDLMFHKAIVVASSLIRQNQLSSDRK